jgi:hypothetical protein
MEINKQEQKVLLRAIKIALRRYKIAREHFWAIEIDSVEEGWPLEWIEEEYEINKPYYNDIPDLLRLRRRLRRI